MKNMIKAIFFDMDGTLFSHKAGKIPGSARNALWKLKERDIKVVVTTGRHLVEMEELSVLDFPFDAYITVNGQICLDEQKEPFFLNPIQGQDKEKLVHIFQEKKIPVIINGRNGIYINCVTEDVQKTQEEVCSAIPPVLEYDGGEIFMASIFRRKENEEDIHIFDNLSITRWNKRAVDVVPIGSGKTKGIEVFLEKYGISREETMAFGDGENDMGMIEFAKIGVAMGNAKTKVQNVADYVADDIDRDGIKKALERFGLIGEKYYV